eukprot:scaffold104121_cov16-Tisochrysis_lutea.AAC.1
MWMLSVCSEGLPSFCAFRRSKQGAIRGEWCFAGICRDTPVDRHTSISSTCGMPFQCVSAL